MARVHPFQTNFTAGELTPKLAGQVDFKKYNNGVEIMENMTVFPQGGASRRYGTRFVKEVKDRVWKLTYRRKLKDTWDAQGEEKGTQRKSKETLGRGTK